MAEGMTSLRASSKSTIVTMSLSRVSGLSLSSSSLMSGRFRRRVFMAASLHRYSRSAPTKPCVTDASLRMSTSFSAAGCFSFSVLWASGMWRVCI